MYLFSPTCPVCFCLWESGASDDITTISHHYKNHLVYTFHTHTSGASRVVIAYVKFEVDIDAHDKVFKISRILVTISCSLGLSDSPFRMTDNRSLSPCNEAAFFRSLDGS